MYSLCPGGWVLCGLPRRWRLLWACSVCRQTEEGARCQEGRSRCGFWLVARSSSWWLMSVRRGSSHLNRRPLTGFLGTGTMMDALNGVGTTDWLRERLKMFENTSASWSGHSLSTRPVMTSVRGLCRGWEEPSYFGSLKTVSCLFKTFYNHFTYFTWCARTAVVVN